MCRVLGIRLRSIEGDVAVERNVEKIFRCVQFNNRYDPFLEELQVQKKNTHSIYSVRHSFVLFYVEAVGKSNFVY